MITALFSDNSIVIDWKGETFEASLSQLRDKPEARILPFKMISEQIGNWKEVQLWLKEKMGWWVHYPKITPLDAEKELQQIEKWRKQRRSYHMLTL